MLAPLMGLLQIRSTLTDVFRSMRIYKLTLSYLVTQRNYWKVFEKNGIIIPKVTYNYRIQP